MKLCALIEIDTDDPRLSPAARDASRGESALQVVRELVLNETAGVRSILCVMAAEVGLDMMDTYRAVLAVGGLAKFERMAHRPGEADPPEAKP